MPPRLQNLEHVVLDFIESGVRTMKTTPLNLGGVSGAGGGVGGPPGGFIGQLPQTRVGYDETEAATLSTPASGVSLVDNLNHIRFRLDTLEDESSALIVDDWDGSPTVTNVDHITFSGGATVSELSAGHVLVQITASGGSGTPFSGTPNSVVLTDGAGALTTLPWLKYGISTEDYIEFGADEVGKESNAGKMGYETFGAGFFYIVGAGTSAGDRWVKILDNLNVDNLLETATINLTNPAATYDIDGIPHTHDIDDLLNVDLTGLDNQDLLIYDTDDGWIPYSRLNLALSAEVIANDGWILASETWTRTGNHTFTLSGDFTVKYRPGTLVRYQDGGSNEYGVIYLSVHSGGTTTITLISNTDYAMAATTITNKYISYINNPEGFPAEFNWAASPTGFSSVPASAVYVWRVFGRTCLLDYNEATSNGTSNATTFTATAPLSPKTTAVTAVLGTTVDNGTVQTTPGRVVITAGSTTITFRKDTASGAWTNANGKRAVAQILIQF